MIFAISFSLLQGFFSISIYNPSTCNTMDKAGAWPHGPSRPPASGTVGKVFAKPPARTRVTVPHKRGVNRRSKARIAPYGYAPRTRFFLSIRRERQLTAPWREETAEALRHSHRNLTYRLTGLKPSGSVSPGRRAKSGAVEYSKGRPVSSAVFRAKSRAAVKVSSLVSTPR